MNLLSPEVVTVTTGVGAVMILLALSRGLVRGRSAGRQCPSCGHLIHGRVCRVCTRPPR
jgi:hypothetical protein